ncbi:MAG TPA: hypothetical protein VEW03_01640, partial [Longimicrobiaceae bacterium]|nr:hypothetical protein [Longimicrobiaceae bacterium]
QGWVEREGPPGTEGMAFTLTREGRHVAGLAPLYARAAALLPAARDLVRARCGGAAGMAGALEGWAEQVRREWDLPRAGVPLLVQWQVRHHLDGHAAAPVMGVLALGGALPPPGSDARELPAPGSGCGPEALRPLLAVPAALGWAEWRDGRVRLTQAGAIAAAYARQYWYPLSYLETFIRVRELLFGDPGALRAGAEGGAETHVDRALDIAFSGGVFDRTCRGPFLEAALPLFDGPLEDQPRAVVDTGCGNGALLAALWEGIRDHTLRGRSLDAHPLVLVGVDPSPVAREATAARLAAAGAPHRVAHGDVTDPAALADAVAALGVDPFRALHVSKSVIHNRTWHPPSAPPAPDRLPRSTGAFAAPDGSAIDNAALERNLAELFAAWLPLAREHGMLVVEAHTTPPPVVAGLLGRTVATLLDATHGYSGQLLVEPEVFVEAAREAGFVPRSHRPLGATTAGHTVLTLTHFVVTPT